MKLNTNNLKDVEAGFLVVAAGTYFAKVTSKKLEPNKPKTGNNLVIQVKLLDDTLIRFDGEKRENKGNALCTRWISMVKTEKYDPDRAIKELALASGRDEKSEDDFNIEDISEYLKVVLEFEPAGRVDGKNLPDRNSISKFLPITAEDNFTPPSI